MGCLPALDTTRPARHDRDAPGSVHQLTLPDGDQISRKGAELSSSGRSEDQLAAKGRGQSPPDWPRPCTRRRKEKASAICDRIPDTSITQDPAQINRNIVLCHVLLTGIAARNSPRPRSAPVTGPRQTPRWPRTRPALQTRSGFARISVLADQSARHVCESN